MGKAWIDSRNHARAVGGIRDQLVNGHDSNLREDLDEFRAEVRAGFDDVRRDMRGIRQDIGGVRGELRDEREARLDLERRIETAKRRHPEQM
ncbi:DUF2746 domain-containing protein [Mycobacterium botniense]|uniref:DUF2746 domain-containing protein n=1 Tax=Mycobacterium botniense TaxID=84962 RepID=UPI0013D77363|nr:DUF2746 domain-containing protein [Mycobacterium botniense]